MADYKFGACLPTFASCADRYCLSGYGGGADTIEGMLDLAVTVPGLKGIELVGNWHINDENIQKMKKETKDRGLEICMVTPDLWTQKKWRNGSLAAADKNTRAAAVDEVKKSMDWAAEAGCKYVDVWPGQDGYDYHFQADYEKTWQWMVEGTQQCADHRKDGEVLIEYKIKEPRTHIFMNSASKVLLLIDQVDRENVGCLLDLGHSSAAGENPAEAVALLSRPAGNKLSYMHFNDNWHLWDDDMMACSVHLYELLETLYWLKKTGYSGWLTLDIFPYREDGVGAATESIQWIKGLLDKIDKFGMDEIGDVISKNSAVESSRFLREMFL